MDDPGSYADWSHLVHAYAPATDTPGHLLALTQHDEPSVHAALDHLWGSVLHQGSIYPATAPAAAYLSDALAEGRFAGGPIAHGTTREEAVARFLAESLRSSNEAADVAELPPERKKRLDDALRHYDEDALWGDEELVNDLNDQSIHDLRSTATGARAAARKLLEKGEVNLKPWAIDLLAQATLADAEGDRDETQRVAHELIASGDEPARVAAVLALSDLSCDTSTLLDDRSLAVRVAAALAPETAADPKPQTVLREAALDPTRLDAAFTPHPPQIEMEARFYVLRALAEHTRDFADLLPAALACLPLAGPYTVEFDWGLLLKAARRLHPGPLSAATRVYLAALVERGDLWDPRNGNAEFVFRDADLPFDRAKCAELAGVRLRWWHRLRRTRRLGPAEAARRYRNELGLD